MNSMKGKNMSTYEELTQEIKELQKKALELKKQERKNIIAEIKSKIAEFELTPSELGLSKNKTTRSTKSVQPKYRNPETGDTWSGRGIAPKWIKEAEKSGRTRDSFLI